MPRRWAAGVGIFWSLWLWQVGGRRAFHDRHELRASLLAWDRNESARPDLVLEFGLVSQWDVTAVSNMSGLCAGLQVFNEDIGAWDTSAVTDMSYLFAGASNFNQSISSWSTARVTSMRGMFCNATAFNQPLNTFATVSVVDMSYMFYGAASFNRPVDLWSTGSVKDMSYMFCGARAFNQCLHVWDTSAVQNMSGMFQDASAFNNHCDAAVRTKALHSQRSSYPPLSRWRTGAVRDMSSMFKDALVFNQPLGSWETSAVTSMRSMFHGAAAFNQDLLHWDVSRVRDMSFLFAGTSSFNKPLASWKTSAVTNMSSMFQHARLFNQPLGAWDVASTQDMRCMFCQAFSFDQPLNQWKTGSVVDMSSLFEGAHEFNQPLGDWDTSAVKSFSRMFFEASTFNQPLSSWHLSSVRNLSGMFMRASSFDQPLVWDTWAVKDFSFMFQEAWRFNQPLTSWDTSGAVDMRSMFAYAGIYNQPLANFNTSLVTDMSFMFCGAAAFDQSLDTWDTASVTNMSGMFYHAWSFNRPLDDWDTSSVVDMSRMFLGASEFDHPLRSWSTSSVTNMSAMFQYALRFNQPLSTWNTSGVQDMLHMFFGASSFDQSLGPWRVSQALGSATILAEGGFSECRRLTIMKSWELDVDYAHLPEIGCPSCSLVPCPGEDLACLGHTCVPMVLGFLELGKAEWQCPDQSFVGRIGFAACAERCRNSSYCTGFLLRSDDGCLQLTGPLPTKLRGGRVAAFWKQTCATFSCPACWAVRAETPRDSNVSEASCCECAAANQVQDMSKAPDLSCVPCPAGHQPSENRTGCEVCPISSVAVPGSTRCRPCVVNFIPSADLSTCVACPPNMYAFMDDVRCRSCKFPYVFLNGGCIWWHWPLIAAAVFVLLGVGRAAVSRVRKRRFRERRGRQAKVEAILKGMEWELWDEQPDTVERYLTILEELGLSHAQVEGRVAGIRAAQSVKGGVSLRYLLSPNFARLARDRTGERDPTFNCMKEAFWLRADAIGQSIVCPRDGRLGCALVDWLPRADRREQTHYLSWTWMYRLDELRSALEMFASSILESHQVFFYMCFFVNNQFRILVDGSAVGSQDLELTFRQNLTRTGHMVAVLDTWHQPVYLTRIWTVFEQFAACTLQVQVTFIMPQASMNSLELKILQGESGLKEVTDSVCRVDSAGARAWDPRDEAKVKETIQETVGFEYVNRHVRKAMLQWISTVVRDQFQNLVDLAQEQSRHLQIEDGSLVWV